VLPRNARITHNPVGDFRPGLMNHHIPGRLIAVDYPNPNPVLGPEGDASDHLWRIPPIVVPFPLTEEDTLERACIASVECMERLRFYRAIFPYLVLIGTVIAPPFGGQYEHGYIHDFPNVPDGPESAFDWSPFLYYIRYQFTWSVFLEWAFPFDEHCWSLLTEQSQRDLHAIFSVLFGYTGAGVNLVAPDFPRWAYPITHEHWSTFCRKQQHIVGQILSNTHYWRGMLDAAFAAGLTRCQYDANIPYESDNDSDTNHA
jgi:hypothetical protein